MASDFRTLNVLSLQPFYGGSHRAFVDGWVEHSRHRWQQETLPDRFWKWRMRHAAVEFARRLEGHDATSIDLIFTTDMLNVAEFRGLVSKTWRATPVVVYFHENQAAYPNQSDSERDLHYAFTNLTTCLAADAVWFNSVFNRDSFLSEMAEACRGWPDFVPRQELLALRQHVGIAYPGVNFSTTPPMEQANDKLEKPGPIHIVWAARWEHDKNPLGLFEILSGIKNSGIEFQVSVVGEQFRNVPQAFHEIEKEFQTQISHWGFLPSREDYERVLKSADVFLSTADHEFFGLAAVEAMLAGAYPILPNRLAYPEVVRHAGIEAGFYDSNDDAVKLIVERERELEQIRNSEKRWAQSEAVRSKLGWEVRAKELDQLLSTVMPG